MTYKINYCGKNYEIDFHKDIMTDGYDFFKVYCINYKKIEVRGSTEKEVVRKFCREVDRLERKIK